MINLNKLNFERSGQIVEGELFGKIKKEKYLDNLGVEEEAARKKFDFYVRNSYVNFNRSVDAVKASQPVEKTKFAGDLLGEIIRKWDLDDKEALKFYTAVGSHLDYHHKTDAIIELEIGGAPVRVLIDITCNRDKVNEKADIIFLVPEDGLDESVDETQYKTYLAGLAEDVKDVLVEKLKKITKEEQ